MIHTQEYTQEEVDAILCRLEDLEEIVALKKNNDIEAEMDDQLGIMEDAANALRSLTTMMNTIPSMERRVAKKLSVIEKEIKDFEHLTNVALRPSNRLSARTLAHLKDTTDSIEACYE